MLCFDFVAEAMCDLTICKLSDWTSPVSGKKEIILLCDKVTKGISTRNIRLKIVLQFSSHLFNGNI